jgi:hypothetical protein
VKEKKGVGGKVRSEKYRKRRVVENEMWKGENGRGREVGAAYIAVGRRRKKKKREKADREAGRERSGSDGRPGPSTANYTPQWAGKRAKKGGRELKWSIEIRRRE